MILGQRFYHLSTPKPQENPPNNILYISYHQLRTISKNFGKVSVNRSVTVKLFLGRLGPESSESKNRQVDKVIDKLLDL